MNLYNAAACVRHIMTSRSSAGHGVHSPYVYDFLTNVVRKKTDEEIISRVERLRREMRSDRRIVKVSDLGAGSVKTGSVLRAVSEIADSSALPKKEAALLARIVQHSGLNVQGERIIIELGTSLGISTLAMALSAPGEKVLTVEGCPVLAELARQNLRRHGATNAEVLNMEFSSALNKLAGEGIKARLAFIDGNHRGAAFREYITTLAAMGEEMIIIADDIRLSRDMYNAWRSVALAGPADATIETMRFGIIFRKRSITPGYYRIRY